MKRPDQKIRATLEFLLDRGTQTVFQESLRAVTQALWVTCSTEIEAAEIRKRDKTAALAQYWRGRHDGAWSIRRHSEQLEMAADLLYKLVTEVPLGTVSQDDLRKQVRRAKALGRPKNDD